MTLKELIQKVFTREPHEELPESEDMTTKDRYLRSLRRERRIQLEEVEKEHLKQIIANYKKDKARQYLWGMKDEKDKLIRAKKASLIKKKKLNVLQNYGSYFK